MRHTFRRAIQVALASLFLMVAGTTAAFAGPAPIAPEFPPPADPQPVTSDGFPWMLTSVAVLLAVITVAAIAVLLARTRTGHDSGLVTP
jgi:ABC-type uncharacterized transport system permease subunit